MGDKEQNTLSNVDGIFSLFTKPIIGFIRYFIPPIECSISISEKYNHTFIIKNIDKRKLYVKSIHPMKGFFSRKYSVKVDKKINIRDKCKTELYYPFDEMEWCVICIKRVIPIPLIKEVKENRKLEFFIV